MYPKEKFSFLNLIIENKINAIIVKLPNIGLSGIAININAIRSKFILNSDAELSFVEKNFFK
jgi:hypothetical protein